MGGDDVAEWCVTGRQGDGCCYEGPEGRVFFAAGPAHDADGRRRVRNGRPVFGIDLTDLRDSSRSLGSPRRLSVKEADVVIERIRTWAAVDLDGVPFDLHFENGIEDEAGTVRPYPRLSKRDRKKFGNRIERG